MPVFVRKIDLLECTRCGKCREVCQSYKCFMNESFSPRGRLKLIYTFYAGEITQSNSFDQRILSCMLCGFCQNICPLEIDLPMLIYKARADMKKKKFFYFLKYFSLYPHLFFSLLKIFRNSFISEKLIKKFPKNQFLQKYLTFKEDQINQKFLKTYSVVKPKGRVAVFLGCSTKYLMPSIGKSLISLLNKIKYEVILPEQLCCGAPLLSAGFKEDSIKLAKKNLEIYKAFNIEGVVTPCPTCAHFLRDVYSELLNENLTILNIEDLLNENLAEKEISMEQQSVCFHPSCHTINYIRDNQKILNLLKKQGFREIQQKKGCCGFAGLFSFLFEKQSMDILREKVLEYEKNDMIVTSCPNCIIQFKFAMKNKKIFHYIEVIEKSYLKGEKNAG